MNRRERPGEPGKTLPEQIEGDHAYRDEPPEHAPEEPETERVTVYTIHEESGNWYETTDHLLAYEHQKAGLRVTARIEEWEK